MASKTRFHSKPGSVTKGGALGSMSKAPAGSVNVVINVDVAALGKLTDQEYTLGTQRAEELKALFGDDA